MCADEEQLAMRPFTKGELEILYSDTIAKDHAPRIDRIKSSGQEKAQVVHPQESALRIQCSARFKVRVARRGLRRYMDCCI